MKENKSPEENGKSNREAQKSFKKVNEKAKQILFKDDTSSSDESANYHNICDDDTSDYINEDSNM